MAYRVEKWLIGETGGAKWIEVNYIRFRTRFCVFLNDICDNSDVVYRHSFEPDSLCKEA